MSDVGDVDWDSVVFGCIVIGIGVGGSYAMYLVAGCPNWLYMSMCLMLMSISLALLMNLE